MKNITPTVYYIGVNDFKTDLFEGLWPLPEGVSYNSYLIKGKKIAIIDLVKNPFAEEFLNNIESITSFDTIDYIIMNHMEPDHTGALPLLCEKAPQATIICSKRAKAMLESLYDIKNNVEVVTSGDKIDLGGRELVFTDIPLVHWPETMVSYDTSEKILFSGDAFGSFKALTTGISDDVVDSEIYKEETIRYYSNIVGKYSKYVLNAIEKLKDLDIKIIAPTHGLVWKKDLEKIVSLYKNLAEMVGSPSVVLIWGSMYDNTKNMIPIVEAIAKEEGIPITVLDASRTDLSFLIAESWKNKGIILGFPTYDGGIFPKISFYLHLIQRKNLKNRIVGFFGSSLWSGRALNEAADSLQKNEWIIIDPIVEFKGAGTEETKKLLREMVKNLSKELKA